MNENEKFLCTDKFRITVTLVFNTFRIFHYLLHVRRKHARLKDLK